MLLHHFDLLLALWLPAFAQRTTFDHAVAVLTGLLCAYGRRTVSRSLAFLGRALLPWANHYHAFSRACWDPDELFKPIINAAKPFLPELPFVSVGIDDTSLKKTGKHIKAARWLRDTLSPPFHVNLRFGIRCLHCALLLPMHSAGLPPTAISLSFEPAPPLKKPPKNAPAELHKKYKKEKKRFTLGARAIERIKKLREWFDLAGLAEKILLVVVDGGYTNSTVLTKLPERVNLIGRVRKDIAICRPAPEGSRKVYGERLPTPEEIRKSDEYEYKTISIFYGGRGREIRYKEVDNILWEGGARRRRTRLFVIAPAPYRPPGRKR